MFMTALVCFVCCYSAKDPSALRLKELCESVEAFAVIEAFISASARAGRPTEVIAECACGHGLVGILLAYRFPHVQVICVDLFKRDAFESVIEAIRAGLFCKLTSRVIRQNNS